MLKLNIQLFAEGDGVGLDEFLGDLGGDPKADEDNNDEGADVTDGADGGSEVDQEAALADEAKTKGITVEALKEEKALEEEAKTKGITPEELKKQKEAAANANKNKAPNPVAVLRKKAEQAEKLQAKIDSAINRLTDGDYDLKLKDFKDEKGKIDYDALIEAMDAADVAARATSQGITPEIQALIEKNEQERKAIEREKMRVEMDRRLNSFQLEFGLDATTLNNFIADAMKMGINPLLFASQDKSAKGTQGLKYAYDIVYQDRIIQKAVDKAVEEARAKWEAEAAAKTKEPKSNPARPNNSQTNNTDPKGVALEDFLKGTI